MHYDKHMVCVRESMRENRRDKYMMCVIENEREKLNLNNKIFHRMSLPETESLPHLVLGGENLSQKLENWDFI